MASILSGGSLNNSNKEHRRVRLRLILRAICCNDNLQDVAPRSLVWISSRNISDNSGRFYLCEVVSYHG
ncbi:hypothetical protein, partial [Endozoicomonas ascidiicola]|uniref:hypothetical protein n=1 Tax=Endozoicomonas ascidiicola TaxID=1698521 RepID=UPI001C12CBE6